MASGLGARTEMFGQWLQGALVFADQGQCPGRRFFVDSGAAQASDAAGYGDSPDRPFATLDYAIGIAESGRGDIIYVAPGHAETLTAPITVDKANLRIQGQGIMGGRPVFTLDTATDHVNIDALNVHISGLKLQSDVNDLACFVDINEANCIIEDCWMETSTGKEALCFLDLAETGKGNLIVRDCYCLQPTDPEGTDQAVNTGWLYAVDASNILIERCTALGNFETAIIHNKTTECLNLFIRDCRFRQDLSTGLLIEMDTDTTGGLERVYGHSPNADDATAAKCIGTYGTAFWVSGDSYFSNDSGGGGQLMINSETACT